MTSTPPTPSFSDAARHLEEILEQLKSGSLPLETAMALFEEGVQQIGHCQTHLSQARGKVEMLVKTLQEDGEPTIVPFEDDPRV